MVIGGPCELRLRGCTGIATTADYRIPVSRGGTLDDGLLGACAWCNNSRGNLLLSELEGRR